MKKVLLVARVDLHEVSNRGVIKKLLGQQKALRSIGYDADLIVQNNNTLECNSEVIYRFPPMPRFWIQFNWYQYLHRWVKDRSYDLIILRYGVCTASLVSFLVDYHQKHPKARFVWDMPTYPYHQEWSGLTGKLVLYMDNLFRSRAQRYISKVIHLGAEKEIWGLPCISITNGIHADDAPLRVRNLKDNEIRIIAVGKWQYWHGLDRIIQSIADNIPLVKEKNLHLDIVGSGPIQEDLVSMVESFSLQSHIHFLSPLSGVPLDLLFDHASIAIGTLGLYRKNVSIDSSLKHREYCLRGIPFILSSEDLDFSPHLPFVQYVPSDDNSIPLKSIIQFIERSTELSPNEIRSYALMRLSWEERMRHVIDSIDIES